MHVMMILLVIAKFFLSVTVLAVHRQVVLMKMEHSNHEEHEQQTAQAGDQCGLRSTQQIDRVRQ